MGINSLTFSATEYIRQQILSRNIDTNVFGSVESNITPTGTIIGTGGGSEKSGTIFVSPMRDMSVVDQLPTQEMGEFFIDQLYLANKYGPVGGFDDLVVINTVILDSANLGPYNRSVLVHVTNLDKYYWVLQLKGYCQTQTLSMIRYYNN